MRRWCLSEVQALMKNAMTIIALLALMQGCTAQSPQRPAFELGDFMSSALKELPYDSQPQVIYRIDNHRFVTLERYRDCYHGESYYNDTRAGIRKFLGRGMFENFQGRIINADPTGGILFCLWPIQMDWFAEMAKRGAWCRFGIRQMAEKPLPRRLTLITVSMRSRTRGTTR